MRRDTDVRYPHSANLFRFCRLVLDHKYGARVIDQQVGALLGFDPADCSHWKKGKKNIKSIEAMKNIAQRLEVEESLIVGLASGDYDEIEAFQEYSGLGAFAVDQKVMEKAKKDYYRSFAGQWDSAKEHAFKKRLSTDLRGIDDIVRQVHKEISFTEAPLYLLEVPSAFPQIVFRAIEDAETGPAQESLYRGFVHIEKQEQKFVIRYKKGSEVKPYVRFQIAKALAAFFLGDPAEELPDLPEFASHIKDVEGNVFAAKFLVPANLLRKEIEQTRTGIDLVRHLAETFWVSRTLINCRLKGLTQELPSSAI